MATIQEEPTSKAYQERLAMNRRLGTPAQHEAVPRTAAWHDAVDDFDYDPRTHFACTRVRRYALTRDDRLRFATGEHTHTQAHVVHT